MKKFTLLAIAALISVVAFAQKPKQILRNAEPIARPTYMQAHKSVSAAQAQVLLAKQAKTKRVPAKVEADPDYATVTLTAGDVWGDGSGYQLLLDADATAYDAVYSDGLEAVPYSDFEYKIPENADYSTETENIVFNNSVTIKIPAGTYDYVVTNPSPGDRVYIAGSGLVDDFVFEKGKVYDFIVALSAQGDAVSVAIDGEVQTPAGPTLVEVPAGAEILEYVMTYKASATATEINSVPMKVAVVDDVVYFQGLSSWIPESWVKGTKNGNTVTFPANQWEGTYGTYGDCYAFYNRNAVFTYNPEDESYTAPSEFYGIGMFAATAGSNYYDGHYFNGLIKKVVEKAAVPANPSISQIYASQWGDEVVFDVPTVDVDGDGLLTSKLFFQFYSDIEHEVAPVTFEAGNLYPYLDADITVIPYGFKDADGAGYDFYDGEIFLNMDHSTWNKIGIKSIYTGGGETNETEILWFDIKDYAPELADGQVKATWVAAEQGYENAQDVTEFVIDENISATVSQADNNNNGPKYYSTGSALRLYGQNTLTITAGADVQQIDKIVLNFSNTSYVGASNDFPGGLETDVETYTLAGATGTWEGVANDVTFTNPNPSGHARIQSIDVYYTLADQGEEPVEQSGITVDPAEGNVESLSTVTVTFNDIYVEIIGDEDDARAELFNTETEEVVAEAPIYEVGGNKLIIVFSEEVTEPGDYLLIIPDGTLQNSRTEEPIGDLDFHYTIGTTPSELPEFTYNFDDGTLQGWTTIDADGDGFNWTQTDSPNINSRSGNGSVYSESWNADEGPLTPDNYLVSPKLKLDGSITFYACAQDADYPSEHFGVYVSTKGNVDPADFEKASEWDLTASRAKKAPRKAPGNWYEYTVDLSGYAGQEGYVAIRHFDCSDWFYLVVDDITLRTSEVAKPDVEVNPAEGLVESLGTVTVTFNNYYVELVDADNAQAELYYNGSDEPVTTASIFEVGGKSLVIMLDEQTAKGDYTLLIPDGTLKKSADESILGELSFSYQIYPKTLVTAPEGDAETWFFNAQGRNGKVKNVEVGVVIDGNDIYVQGLNEAYLPEAWVKGSLNEDGTATFETGQYFGVYSYQGIDYDMWFLGTADASTASDLTFTYDAEAGELALGANDFIVINALPNEISYYEYYYEVTITRNPAEYAEAIEAPADLVSEPYLLKALDSYYDEEVTYQVQVGRYGENEVYIQGLSSMLPEAWLKGTIDADNVVTVPATNLGIYQSWFGDYELTSETTTFTYDPEADQYHADAFISVDENSEPWDELEDVLLTKVVETAATPANPDVVAFRLYKNIAEDDTELVYYDYPYVGFDIPAEDVDGNILAQAKMSYVIYVVDADDVQKELTLTTDLYTELAEDLTEIPYSFTDNYDVYAGGSTVYLNQDPAEIESWKKIGVQSINRGLGEEHRSEIGWFDIQAYIADQQAALDELIGTGIKGIAFDAENARFFDLQGRAADKTRKGLLIMQTADGKTVKVVRK